jgi:hypothetical protein
MHNIGYHLSSPQTIEALWRLVNSRGIILDIFANSHPHLYDSWLGTSLIELIVYWPFVLNNQSVALNIIVWLSYRWSMSLSSLFSGHDATLIFGRALIDWVFQPCDAPIGWGFLSSTVVNRWGLRPINGPSIISHYGCFTPNFMVIFFVGTRYAWWKSILHRRTNNMRFSFLWYMRNVLLITWRKWFLICAIPDETLVAIAEFLLNVQWLQFFCFE